MNRRGFLKTMLAAPAIVRAGSLMKLWVPPQEIVTVDATWLRAGDMYVNGRLLMMGRDFTYESGSQYVTINDLDLMPYGNRHPIVMVKGEWE